MNAGHARAANISNPAPTATEVRLGELTSLVQRAHGGIDTLENLQRRLQEVADRVGGPMPQDEGKEPGNVYSACLIGQSEGVVQRLADLAADLTYLLTRLEEGL